MNTKYNIIVCSSFVCSVVSKLAVQLFFSYFFIYFSSYFITVQLNGGSLSDYVLSVNYLGNFIVAVGLLWVYFRLVVGRFWVSFRGIIDR